MIDAKAVLQRLPGWFGISGILLLLIYFVAFQQLGVLVFKLLQVTFGIVVGYVADRALFKYVTPIDEVAHDNFGASRMLARAIIVGSVLVALAIGL